MKTFFTKSGFDRFGRTFFSICERLGHGEQCAGSPNGGVVVCSPVREPLYDHVGACLLLTRDLRAVGAFKAIDFVRDAVDQGNTPVLCFVEDGTTILPEMLNIEQAMEPGTLRLLPFGSVQDLELRAELNIPIASAHINRIDLLPDDQRCLFFDRTTPDYTGLLADFGRVCHGESGSIEFRDLHVRTMGPLARISAWIQAKSGETLSQATTDRLERKLNDAFARTRVSRLPTGKKLVELLTEQGENCRRFVIQVPSHPEQVQKIATVCYKNAVPIAQLDLRPRRDTVDGVILNDIVLKVDLGAIPAAEHSRFVAEMEKELDAMRDPLRKNAGRVVVPLE